MGTGKFSAGEGGNPVVDKHQIKSRESRKTSCRLVLQNWDKLQLYRPVDPRQT